MNRSLLGYLIMLSLVVLSVVHMAVTYPKLPHRVISHFNAQGQAVGWMDKGSFVAFYAGTVLGMVLLMLVVVWLLPRSPKWMINLPNKDYWLAAEREKASFASITSYFLWFINATLILLIVCFEICFARALGRNPAAWEIPVVMGVYPAFTAAWCVSLLRRFRKPKQA